MLHPTARDGKRTEISLHVFLDGNNLQFQLVDREDGKHLFQGHSFFNLTLSKQQTKQLVETIRTTNLQGAVRTHPNHLIELGRELFVNLFPEALQEILRTLTASSLLVEMDESLTWLPWELLHDGTDFLTCRFAMGRWIRGCEGPDKSRVRRQGESLTFGILTNPQGDLPAASAEGRRMSELLAEHPSQIQTVWLNHRVDQSGVQELLPHAHVLHYSGHAERKVALSGLDVWPFTTGQLEAASIEEGQVPFLVFANACGSARDRGEGHDNPQLSSIAARFLDCGCLHYIGTLCDLPDQRGGDFAAVFYERLLEGVSVGEALRRARTEHRAASGPSNSTWAQYVLYGDPATGVYGDVQVKLANRTVALLADESTSELISAVSDALNAYPSAFALYNQAAPCLAVFELPSDAVRFTLLVQQNLHNAGKNGRPQSVRTAICSGEVQIESARASGLPITVRGHAVDVAEAFLSIADSGRVLLARAVFDGVRQSMRSHEVFKSGRLQWHEHGAYQFAGLEGLHGVCEVGLEGHSSFSRPLDSARAKRFLSSDQEPVLGWRPGIDLEIPTSPEWTLTEKLGEGGFGEVWRARRNEGTETRVFKFCFKADRVRSLKREMALFQMFTSALGENDRVVHIHGIYLDAAPYYIEMEDIAGGTLADWWERRGGADGIRLEERLEIVSQVADALQDAHDAGIIHRDVKPSNILVSEDSTSRWGFQIKLSDFGIGQVLSPESSSSTPLPGFTGTFTPTEIATHSGTRIYMAPELLVGKPASTRSDIYSLGVVLYQLVAGDLHTQVTAEWKEEIEDPLIRSDLERCIAGNPAARYPSPSELSTLLRSLPARSVEYQQHQANIRKSLRRKRITIAVGAFSILLALISSSLGYGLVEANRAHKVALAEKENAEQETYFSNMALAQRYIDEQDTTNAMDLLTSSPKRFRNWEWNWLLSRCTLDQMCLRVTDKQPNAIALTNNKTEALIGYDDGTLALWDLNAGSMIKSYSPLPRAVESVAVSNDGFYAAARTVDRIQFYELESGNILRAITATELLYGPLDFNPKSGVLAVFYRKETRVRQYHADPERDSMPLTGHLSWVTDLEYSPNGTMLAAAYLNQSPWIWNVATGTSYPNSTLEGTNAGCVAFNPDGTVLAIGGRQYDALMIDSRNLTVIRHPEPMPGITDYLEFSSDGTSLFCVNDGHNLLEPLTKRLQFRERRSIIAIGDRFL